MAVLLAFRRLYDLPELVGANQFIGTVFFVRIFYSENERATIGSAAAPGVPIFIGHRTKSVVFVRQVLQGGVDGLFF